MPGSWRPKEARRGRRHLGGRQLREPGVLEDAARHVGHHVEGRSQHRRVLAQAQRARHRHLHTTRRRQRRLKLIEFRVWYPGFRVHLGKGAMSQDRQAAGRCQGSGARAHLGFLKRRDDAELAVDGVRRRQHPPVRLLAQHIPLAGRLGPETARLMPSGDATGCQGPGGSQQDLCCCACGGACFA